MALPQVRIDATEARIAALDIPSGAAWASEARQDALRRLRTMGLPGPRDEYWRFTRPDDLNAVDVPEAALFDAKGEAPVFGEIDRLRREIGIDRERSRLECDFLRAGAGTQREQGRQPEHHITERISDPS